MYATSLPVLTPLSYVLPWFSRVSPPVLLRSSPVLPCSPPFLPPSPLVLSLSFPVLPCSPSVFLGSTLVLSRFPLVFFVLLLFS